MVEESQIGTAAPRDNRIATAGGTQESSNPARPPVRTTGVKALTPPLCTAMLVGAAGRCSAGSLTFAAGTVARERNAYLQALAVTQGHSARLPKGLLAVATIKSQADIQGS